MISIQKWQFIILHNAPLSRFIMSSLNILVYPDKRLQVVAKPVMQIDNRIQKIICDMTETMYKASGIGLAATQVGINESIVVMDISETHDRLHILINPEIVSSSQKYLCREEGCLSVPGIRAFIRRSEWVKVRALNEKGKRYEFLAEGLLSICIQHEIDHLSGKIFIEYLSLLKQNLIRKKINKSKCKNFIIS